MAIPEAKIPHCGDDSECLLNKSKYNVKSYLLEICASREMGNFGAGGSLPRLAFPGDRRRLFFSKINDAQTYLSIPLSSRGSKIAPLKIRGLAYANIPLSGIFYSFLRPNATSPVNQWRASPPKGAGSDNTAIAVHQWSAAGARRSISRQCREN